MADEKLKKDLKSRKTSTCYKCKFIKEERDTILCSLCKKRYDFDCIGISEKLYRLMTHEKKAKLKCMSCTQDSKSVKSVMAATTSSDDHCNITKRKKNLSSLKETTVTPNVSQISLQQDTLTYDTSYDDGNPDKSVTDRLSKSEDFTTLDLCNINELNEQVADLQSNLMITQQELENTIIENNDLKRQIIKLNKEIKLLKGVCQTGSNLNTTDLFLSMTPQGKNYIKRLTCSSPKIMNASATDITSEIILTLQKKIADLQRELSVAKEEISTLHKQIDVLGKNVESHSTIVQQTNTNIKTSQEIYSKKEKLVVLSTLKSNTILRALEHNFGQKFNFCHYTKPGARILDLLNNIEEKLQDLKTTDCCIIFIGEADFKLSQNNKNLVCCIRDVLQNISVMTNIIICAPIYICGSKIYNCRVENFNNLLYSDIQTYNYGILYDTNKNLNLAMFSSLTGRINNYGLRHLMHELNEVTDNLLVKNTSTRIDSNICENKGLHNIKSSAPCTIALTAKETPSTKISIKTTLFDYFPVVSNPKIEHIANKFFR